jgi:hypothetical protein
MKTGKMPIQKLDYDIGHLVKSPCRECRSYGMFPDCMDSCATLDRVRTALSNSLSCVHNHSALESFSLGLEAVERV